MPPVSNEQLLPYCKMSPANCCFEDGGRFGTCINMYKQSPWIGIFYLALFFNKTLRQLSNNQAKKTTLKL